MIDDLSGSVLDRGGEQQKSLAALWRKENESYYPVQKIWGSRPGVWPAIKTGAQKAKNKLEITVGVDPGDLLPALQGGAYVVGSTCCSCHRSGVGWGVWGVGGGGGCVPCTVLCF